MSLLECLVGLAIASILLAPLLKNSSEFMHKQIQIEKNQLLASDADRALELIGRSIRMAGYQQLTSPPAVTRNSKNIPEYIHIQKGGGFRGSDSLMVKHELSKGVDYDCIGNTLSKERTKNQLAQQGFVVDRQASAPKGKRVNGGSLICQSLDKQGRLQNTTLMSGIQKLSIEALPDGARRAYRVRLEMTDGISIHTGFERIFTARNL